MDAGVPYEFYTTISTTGVNNGYITNLSLREVDAMGNPTNIIAQSDAPDTINSAVVSRDRDMSILFKGVGTGNPV